MRLQNIIDSNRSTKKLTDHLPTRQGNEDLLGLEVVGKSVFESEKACALRLITGRDDIDKH